MLYRDCIEKLLQLKDVIVTNIECQGREMHIWLRMEQRMHFCPCCGTITGKVHDYRTQLVKDISISGYDTILHLRKRRHVCPECGKRFDERIDFLPRYRQFTNRVSMQIFEQLKECRSIKSIAVQNNMSPPTAARIINEINFKTGKLPQVLAIDEFRGNAEGEKFQCILADPENRRIVDILPNRKHDMIRHYLLKYNNRKAVKFVVMDMTGGYRKLMHELFPQAKIIVDKYHFIRQVTWAIENVRKRLQRSMPVSLRKYYKRSRKLILTRYKKLKDENKQACDLMLHYSEDLRLAHRMKEWFYDICQMEAYRQQQREFDDWIANAQSCGIKEFEACAKTYRAWRKEILNAFKYGLTNGPTEGFNNKIKVLKRSSYGIRNFKRFRTRILHCTS